MSNNSMKCKICGTQHHPVECPKEEDARAKLSDILTKVYQYGVRRFKGAKVTVVEQAQADILKYFVPRDKILEMVEVCPKIFAGRTETCSTSPFCFDCYDRIRLKGGENG